MGNKEPSVAVLLSAYNGIGWIEEQIVSILSQRNVSIEIFISIDLSTDETYSWCKDFSKGHVNITVLPYGDIFGGAAKNFFRLIRDVDFSSFDYISLSDQDDIWDDKKLEYAIKIIEGNNLEGYSSDVIAFWSNGKAKSLKKSYPQKKFDYLFEAAGPGCTYVFRRKSIQRFKKFLIVKWNDVILVELHDWMIYAYFRSRGMRWQIDNKPLMHYRQHEFNQFGANYGLKAYFFRFLKIKEKWYRKEITNIFQLVNQDINDGFSLKTSFLIKNFWSLRRRPRDAIILFILLIFRLF